MKYCYRFFCSAPVIFFCLVVSTLFSAGEVYGQYYRVGLYQGIALPQRELSSASQTINWLPWLNVHYFGKNNPITMGASLGLQYFDRKAGTQAKGESYDVMTLPFAICFQYLLLPYEFRPYYGIETGVAAYRYRFYNDNLFSSAETGIALTVTPNAGIKLEIFEGMDIDINVRYQFLFHDIIRHGSSGTILTGYQMLGVSLGVNYALWKVYP